MMTLTSICVLLLLLLDAATAFSATPSKTSENEARHFVELTSLEADSTRDRLPASFITAWPTWVLEEGSSTLARIKDEDTGEGFVNPSSIDELWQPIDLKRPEMKLALGLHVRKGTIRHVMPAIDVSYDGSHRNRGLSSVPRAHTWMDWGSIGVNAEEWDRFEMKIQVKKQKENEEWNTLATSSARSILRAMERLITCITETAPTGFEDGSQIVQIVLDNADAIEAPSSRHNLRAVLTNDGAELGVLDVSVATTMAGSESEYLPDAYKPLYNDESLRNPIYQKFKKRKGEL